MDPLSRLSLAGDGGVEKTFFHTLVSYFFAGMSAPFFSSGHLL